MSQMVSYVAIQQFSLGLLKDGKMESISVREGETLSFDGLYVEFDGQRGQARSLSKVIGEWIEPTDGSVEVTQITDPSPSARTRNYSGGREIEDSSPENDMQVRLQQASARPRPSPVRPSSDRVENSSVGNDTRERMRDESFREEMKRLLEEYDRPVKTDVSSDLGDAKKETLAIRKTATIIDEDASEVAKVRQVNTGVKNTSGVQLAETKEEKRAVVSQDGQVAKVTNYNGEKTEEPVRKRLAVEKESEGVVVKKTGTQAKAPAQAKAAPKKAQVVREEDVVVNTSYGTSKSTDVTSSTQSKLAADVIMGSKATSARSTNIIRDTVEDAVVVGRVSKNRQSALERAEGTVNQDGITAKLTVGPEGTIDTGSVHIGSAGDGIEMGDVQIGSGDGYDSDIADGTAFNDDDIDVDDILGKL